MNIARWGEYCSEVQQSWIPREANTLFCSRDPLILGVRPYPERERERDLAEIQATLGIQQINFDCRDKIQDKN